MLTATIAALACAGLDSVAAIPLFGDVAVRYPGNAFSGIGNRWPVSSSYPQVGAMQRVNAVKYDDVDDGASGNGMGGKFDQTEARKYLANFFATPDLGSDVLQDPLKFISKFSPADLEKMRLQAPDVLGDVLREFGDKFEDLEYQLDPQNTIRSAIGGVQKKRASSALVQALEPSKITYRDLLDIGRPARMNLFARGGDNALSQAMYMGDKDLVPSDELVLIGYQVVYASDKRRIEKVGLAQPEDYESVKVVTNVREAIENYPHGHWDKRGTPKRLLCSVFLSEKQLDFTWYQGRFVSARDYEVAGSILQLANNLVKNAVIVCEALDSRIEPAQTLLFPNLKVADLAPYQYQ